MYMQDTSVRIFSRCLRDIVVGFTQKTTSRSNFTAYFSSSTLSQSDNNSISYDRIVRPGRISSRREVPSHIALPNYCSEKFNHDDIDSNIANQRLISRLRRPNIEIKTKEQISLMRDAGKLARKMMKIAIQHLKPGTTTDEIDAVVHEAIINHGAYPSPLLYHGYPKSICTSVNNVVCHGIPDDRSLRNGDIISIDITVYLNGYHGDCAETVPIGTVDDASLRLIEAAKICRDVAIEACSPGVPFSIIGNTISDLANSFGYNVVRTFCGHGIGSYFHGPPEILHFGFFIKCFPQANHVGGRMEPGMTFTIEPVISEGGNAIFILKDGWTAVTVDNSRGAQFEHTILITDNGVENLTI